MGRYIHGYARRGKTHTLYWRWSGMFGRCYHPKNASFKWYGAKGIKVCERWHEFKNFAEDMASTWKPGLTLERKDNNKDYEPSNVIWETTHHQRMTDSHGRVATINGETKRVTRFAEDLKMTSAGVYRRIKDGWSVEKALTTPPQRAKTITFRGQTKTLQGWSKSIRHGHKRLVEHRLANGWSVEDALTIPVHGRRTRT